MDGGARITENRSRFANCELQGRFWLGGQGAARPVAIRLSTKAHNFV